MGAGGGEPELSVTIPEDAEVARLTTELAARVAGKFAVERVERRPGVRWDGAAAPPAELSAARFDRTLDLIWRRTSYSGLTAVAHDGGVGGAPAVGSEPEEGTLDDEATLDAGLPAGHLQEDPAASELVSPMAELPGGTSFGSLVHGVLETVDVSAGDLPAEVNERIVEQLTRWGPAGGSRSPIDPGKLASALLAVYDSPLGPLSGEQRLRDFPPGERLTEMSFELPLSGGDQPDGALTLGALAPVLRRHLRPGDALAAYSDRLGDPLLRNQPLRGFLNGSLDAILRVRDGASARYVVVDYKTNWLGAAAPGSGQLTTADYTPTRLGAAMLASDYPLQALLYSVALHRYLRWRQPDYSPEQHLGGVLYLYLRGMCGPDTPMIDGEPCGVFAWRPPAALVSELSDLLDTGRAAS